jgi:hypothetical protein
VITISAFKWVPDVARGQVRDLRARWALEEAGLPYKTRLLTMGDQDKPEYRALQPFGQVPILEENGLVLFESGAIVLHIGARSDVLLPHEPGAQCCGSSTRPTLFPATSVSMLMLSAAPRGLLSSGRSKRSWEISGRRPRFEGRCLGLRR